MVDAKMPNALAKIDVHRDSQLRKFPAFLAQLRPSAQGVSAMKTFMFIGFVSKDVVERVARLCQREAGSAYDGVGRAGFSRGSGLQ